jgi:succinoglycan biosynthesis transport protein ExoP
MEDLSLQDIFRMLLRWKKYFFITFFLLFTITIIGALNWSNYRSTAFVQIELSTIARSIVNNSNESLATIADQRIDHIQQKITSLESLAEIIKKFGLYPESIDKTPIATLTSKMRNKIDLALISGKIANPALAQKQSAEQLSAIGFRLSFDYSDPQLAQQVTDELVTRFLDEDLKLRRSQTKETSDFITAQIETIEKNIAEQEKEIAEFRLKNGESGPSAIMFNQQAAANLSMNIQSIQAQITASEGTQGALHTQLSIVSPYSSVASNGQVFTSPEVQLKALETEYTTLISQYGKKHPDVVKLRRQISSLKSQTGISKSDNIGELKAQIKDVNTNFIATKNRLGAEHPDVIAIKNQLDTLKSTIAKSSKKKSSNSSIKDDADNPVYIQLKTQLSSEEERSESLIAQRDELIKQRTKYEKILSLNPAVEQEMSRLSRDYDNSQIRFRELKEKKMAADLNEQLELSRKGQRLVVTNPPEVSSDTQPRRLLIILGGLIISMLAGISSVVIAEFSTQTIYGAKHVSSLVGAIPLVVIPHMFSEDENDYTGKSKYLMQKFPMLLKLHLSYRKAIRRFKNKNS